MNSFKTSIVKKFAMLTLAVAGIGSPVSQVLADEAGAPAAQAADYQPRSMDDLQQLAGPVALYPDALLAQVFVAATYPNDVAAAAQYLQDGGDPNQVANQGWDASVQGLVQTPDVLNYLAANPDWMNQIGDAFLNQQQDVMAAVQTLRQQAQAAGNLVSTPQQQVVTTDNCIEIIPADPQVLCVPVYDPEVVYVRRVGFDPCITFCPGIRIGIWMHEDFDWCDHRIYFGDWGCDRPWWRHDGRGFDYIHSRPGIYVSRSNYRSSTWIHDSFKARPVHSRGPAISHMVRPQSRSGNLPVHGTTARQTNTRTVTRSTTNGNHTVTNRNVTNHTVTNHTVTNHTVTNRNVTNHNVTNHTVTNHTVTNRNVPSHVATSHTVTRSPSYKPASSGGRGTTSHTTTHTVTNRPVASNHHK